MPPKKKPIGGGKGKRAPVKRKKFAPWLTIQMLRLILILSRTVPTKLSDPLMTRVTGEHIHTVRLALYTMKISPLEIVLPTMRICSAYGLYSKKGILTINVTLLILAEAGDIEVNPGPAKRNVKYPCGICAKAVKSNQRGIQCDNCDKWLHTRCIGLSCDDYIRHRHGPARNASRLHYHLETSNSDSIFNTSTSSSISSGNSSMYIDEPLSPTPTKRDLTTCHLNAQSIMNKHDEISNYLSNQISPTILGISETWLNKNTPINIEGYTTYRLDCQKSRGGGIVV